MELNIERSTTPQPQPNLKQLTFGTTFTDHMFYMDYEEGKGWHDAKIVPLSTFAIHPAAIVFHYGQAVFEGMKAYKDPNGEIYLFRPEENMKRMNASNERMCMPTFDEDFVLEALKQLVDLDAAWVPDQPGMSLYIRPFMFATEPNLGVNPSRTYRFMIICSPVGAYYAGGLQPVKIAIESQYVRAVKGGTGEAKTAGNYASAMKSQVEAGEKGYAQVLWLDGREQKYIEEVGAMNVFFVINGQVVTPALNGSILPGITRKSVLALLRSWGVPVEERRVAVSEIIQAAQDGSLEEVFGTGTAAVISPVGELFVEGQPIAINDGKIGSYATRIYDTMTGIQYGQLEDPMGWRVKIK